MATQYNGPWCKKRSPSFMKLLGKMCVFAILIVQCNATRDKRETPSLYNMMTKWLSRILLVGGTGTMPVMSEYGNHAGYHEHAHDAATPRESDQFQLIQKDGMIAARWDNALSEVELQEIEIAYADYNPEPEVSYDKTMQIDFAGTPYWNTLKAISETDAFEKILRTVESRIPGMPRLSRNYELMHLFKINHDPAEEWSMVRSRHLQYQYTGVIPPKRAVVDSKKVGCHRDNDLGMDYLIHIVLDTSGENFRDAQFHLAGDNSNCEASTIIDPKRGMVILHSDRVYHKVGKTKFPVEILNPRRRSFVIGLNIERDSLGNAIRSNRVAELVKSRSITRLSQGSVYEVMKRSTTQRLARQCGKGCVAPAPPSVVAPAPPIVAVAAPAPPPPVESDGWTYFIE